jgi:hypothetical protein
MGIGAVTNVQDGVQSGISGRGGSVGGKGVFLFYFLAFFFFRFYVFSLGLHTCTRTRGRLEGVWERCNKELKVWSGEGGCVRAPLGGGSRVQLVYLCIS